ncbi:MAG: hypothetical protein Q9225_008019 [Loekoesia sp. 1 TL-2023]
MIFFTSCTNAGTECAEKTEKVFQPAKQPQAASSPSKEARIAKMSDGLASNLTLREVISNDILATHQSSLPRVSNKPSTVINSCPAYETWHPARILQEFNKVYPGKPVPLTRSNAMNDASGLSEAEHAAHVFRVNYLRENWIRQPQMECYRTNQVPTSTALPRPIHHTPESVCFSTMERRRAEKKQMDFLRNCQMELFLAKRERDARAIKEAKKHGKEAGEHDKMTLEHDGKATAGATEKATEEDWVVVDDMESMEDPFVMVYDEAKLRKTE